MTLNRAENGGFGANNCVILLLNVQIYLKIISNIEKESRNRSVSPI